MKIDNFLLTMFQTCPAKYKLRGLEHWTARRRSAALGFGGAIHTGLATWYRLNDPSTNNAHQAMVAAGVAIDTSWPNNLPVDDWRTKEKCLRTMQEYCSRYPTESFDVVGKPEVPMIECTFTLPTGKFLHCWECLLPGTDADPIHCENCGVRLEEIEYGGIFDGLVRFDSAVYVLEHKTTSMLGQYYFNQFKPNNQITGYIWAGGKLSGERVGGALINAIGIYKASPTKFERQITSRSELEINEWLEGVRQTCLLIQQCMVFNWWPMHTAACCLYGKCEFHDVHVLSTPKERQQRLEMEYIHEPWLYEDRDDDAN